MAVARKPAIARMQQPVEPWQTEYRIKRPGPPDTPRDIEINVSAGNELAIGRQQSNVGEQRVNRHLQLLGDPGLLQSRGLESSPDERLRPKVDPARAEPTLAVVENPAAGWGAHFSVLCHDFVR